MCVCVCVCGGGGGEGGGKVEQKSVAFFFGESVLDREGFPFFLENNQKIVVVLVYFVTTKYIGFNNSTTDWDVQSSVDISS